MHDVDNLTASGLPEKTNPLKLTSAHLSKRSLRDTPESLRVGVPRYRSYSMHLSTVLAVFRELLQNSDDANSAAAEIHFETEAYAKTHEADTALASSTSSDEQTSGRLPDLQTEIVRVHHMTVSFHDIDQEYRCTNGDSRIMVYHSGTRIGTGSRKSVRSKFRSLVLSC